MGVSNAMNGHFRGGLIFRSIGRVGGGIEANVHMGINDAGQHHPFVSGDDNGADVRKAAPRADRDNMLSVD